MELTCNRICPKCKFDGDHPATRRNDVHYADVHCLRCKSHIGFMPKPDDDVTKYKRPKQHTDLVKKFSRGYCELCGFDKEQLPRSETMHAHHVARYCEGGEPTRENVWILCTACHSLVEHQRTYRGKMNRVIAADLEAIKAAMLEPPTGESLEQLVERKRREHGL